MSRPLVAVLTVTTALVAPLAAVRPVAAEEVVIPEITVTAPSRGVPTRIAKAGSAVTVITAEEIAKSGAISIRDVLETVPGLIANSNGGEGSATFVYLRGGNPGQTLVLVDGVRQNDPSQADAGFNFGSYPLQAVERIEVLRGPQSALYGSDAIGGVINIVTKRGTGPLQVSGSAMGGSYGTHEETVGVSGSKNGLSIAAGGAFYHTDGFSRFVDTNEADGTERFNGYARVGWQASEDLAFDLAVDAVRTDAEYDGYSPTTFAPEDQDNASITDLLNARFTTTAKALDGRLTNALTLFSNLNDRRYDEEGSEGDYEGLRYGLEYQGTLEAGDYGRLIFGAGYAKEEISTRYDDFADPTDGATFDADLTHAWVFALHQISLTDQWHVSLSARYDVYEQSGGFATVRATSAYEIPDTETVLRASIGTGAKAPTAYQLFAPKTPYVVGNPDLSAETSIGVDAGIDQTLFDGRATVSATVFYNRYDDLIDYVFPTYENIKSAETAGLELSGRIDLIPQTLAMTADYTYLYARDLDADRALIRRPEHKGSIGLSYTGIDKLTLGARLVMVGDSIASFSGDTENGLAGWARVDLDASYQINDRVALTGRVVNLFDTDYQEIVGYNTSGFAAYAGLKVTY